MCFANSVRALEVVGHWEGGGIWRSPVEHTVGSPLRPQINGMPRFTRWSPLAGVVSAERANLPASPIPTS